MPLFNIRNYRFNIRIVCYTLTLWLCLIVFGINPPNVLAWSDSGLNISGFGTLAISMDDRSDMAPLRDGNQSFKNPHDSDISVIMDSRLGIQTHYRFSPQLNAVVQGVFKEQVSQDIENVIELGHLSFQPVPWVNFRVGRMGYDVFLMADNRNLGYGYPWVRPPIEFYGWLPFFHMDGADLSLSLDQNESQWQIRFQYGTHGFSFKLDDMYLYELDTEDLYTLSLTRKSGPLTLKASYSTFVLKDDMPFLIPFRQNLESVANTTHGIFPGIHHEASELAKHLTYKNVGMDYFSLGGTYEDNDWIIQAEVGHASADTDAVVNGNCGYIAIGHRFGDWTPFAIYSTFHPGQNARHPFEDWSVLGMPELQDLQTMSFRILNSFRMRQDTLSVGVRWDFNFHAALKLQWDMMHTHSYGHVIWYRKYSAADHDSRVGLATLSLDFFF